MVALSGCQASVNADAATGASFDVDEEAALAAEREPPKASSDERSSALLAAGPEAGEPALLGARHDLGLHEPAKSASCACLAVALGPASSPAFTWRTSAPTVDPATQWVVALSSESVSCPDAPSGSAPASYWGYRVEGDDVIVVVEKAKPGRPVTHGAIIPRPSGSGSVYVSPLDGTVPYGRGQDGNARCRLTPTQPG